MNGTFIDASVPACGCPDIDISAWDGVRLRWSRRVFLERPVPFMFGVPAGVSRMLDGMKAALEATGCMPSVPYMLLYRPGVFRGKALLAVDAPDPVPAECVVLPETFLYSTVHHGSAAGAGRARRDLERLAGRNGGSLADILYWPVTCPACAPARGGHRTVVLGLAAGDA